ncbi:MAG: penicillin-binding transpeptidase domain-containing protein [Patescibacteria group bacterium]|nr:penicillin-binding transpeptidase domain-containing protein [Patescibacteria group bacterium]MCL5432198.1 penicillin-binding transpeptidase domain-containing protein [Patescibacteria group bacterium]
MVSFPTNFAKVVLVAAFLVLWAGLFRLQIFQGNYFRALADGNRVRRIPIHAPRGIIYDRNGLPLTINLPAYRLSGQQISKSQAIAAMAHGQIAETDSTRSYPLGPAAAHVVGYVGFAGDKIVGLSGLEQQYEDRLAGKDGQEIVEVDAMGNKLRTLATVPPTPGQDLTISLDAQLQKAAYGQIKDVTGAVVVTNPATGEVLALASAPSFDPNVFTDLTLPADYRQVKIKEIFTDPNQSLFDRAIAGTYPAGSTFKIITATAGLEMGKIDANFQITDPGILIIGPYKFPNWLYLRGGGTQGDLNVVSALQKSNDIFFYEVGGLVGAQGIIEWGKKFGLDAPLGVDLPGEAGGNLALKSDWFLGDTYHLAIGQGNLLVTPLQVNSWTATIANGGSVCQPHLLGQPNCRNIGIQPRNLDLVRQGLLAACATGGTAWPLFNFTVHNTPYQLACKTGTAEYGDPQDRTHAWLTGYGPADLPAGRQVAVTVLVEGGGEGDTVAAPLVKNILTAWFSR